ncbi:MAG: hypothetical protein MJZ11_08070 [Lachnospiraceae bacterium]|nr:hypothetical protein [Lachnospiraceae bacterium]
MSNEIRNALEYKLCQIQMHIKDVEALVSDVKEIMNKCTLSPTIDPASKEKDRVFRQDERTPLIDVEKLSVKDLIKKDFKSGGFGMFTPPDISFNEMKNLGGK